MSVPEIVQAALGDEQPAARVDLGRDDEILVTPSRTLVYRAEGLLSDESVEEFPHGAERVSVAEGRRKAKIELDYGLDGTRTITIPGKVLDDVLHPVLAGVLNAAGVTDAGETAIQTYRFSELTLVITDKRVVKHIGEAVWDDDFEEYRYEDVTRLDFEEGSVAMQVVLVVDGRQERIKAPNQRARELRERIERSLFDYYDVSTREEFDAVVVPDEDEAASGDSSSSEGTIAFGDGLEPLSADPPRLDDDGRVIEEVRSDEGVDANEGGAASVETATRESGTRTTGGTDAVEGVADTGRSNPADQGPSGGVETTSDDAGWEFETAGTTRSTDSGHVATDDELVAELADLREAVERQNERLDAQRRTIERLIEELGRGR